MRIQLAVLDSTLKWLPANASVCIVYLWFCSYLIYTKASYESHYLLGTVTKKVEPPP